MSDLCFCHLNGYKVKDSTARAGIEELNANKVSNEGLANAINGVNNSIAGVQAGVDDLNTRMNALNVPASANDLAFDGSGAGMTSGNVGAGMLELKNEINSVHNNLSEDIELVSTQALYIVSFDASTGTLVTKSSDYVG